jgi:hypothetical protein
MRSPSGALVQVVGSTGQDEALVEVEVEVEDGTEARARAPAATKNSVEVALTDEATTGATSDDKVKRQKGRERSRRKERVRGKTTDGCALLV